MTTTPSDATALQTGMYVRDDAVPGDAVDVRAAGFVPDDAALPAGHDDLVFADDAAAVRVHTKALYRLAPSSMATLKGCTERMCYVG